MTVSQLAVKLSLVAVLSLEGKKNDEGFNFGPKSFIQDLLFNYCSAGIVSIIKVHNRPFYRCLLGDLAFEWRQGWRSPYRPLCICHENAPT